MVKSEELYRCEILEQIKVGFPSNIMFEMEPRVDFAKTGSGPESKRSKRSICLKRAGHLEPRPQLLERAVTRPGDDPDRRQRVAVVIVVVVVVAILELIVETQCWTRE